MEHTEPVYGMTETRAERAWRLQEEERQRGSPQLQSADADAASAEEIDAKAELERANLLYGETSSYCGDACQGAATAAGYTVAAFSKLTLAIITACQATYQLAVAIRHGFQQGTMATLRLFFDCVTGCRLPPPLEIAVIEDQVTYDVFVVEYRALAWCLGGSAMALFVWDWTHGGLQLASWVPIGALVGAGGSVAGIAYAALATPTEEKVRIEVDPRRWLELEEYKSALLTAGGAAAFTACVSGVVAWSMHRYEAQFWSTPMWLLELTLLVGCAVRQCFKTWRGCTRRGRLRLFVGGLGSCAPGWRWWPPLL